MPALPSACPRVATGDGPCVISLDHRRGRSTGPCFPLSVLRCRLHQVAFTLYPPGHVPYGRLAIARVASDGRGIAPETAAIESIFVGPLFDASLDAAEQKPWAREWETESTHWWHTQCRHIESIASL